MENRKNRTIYGRRQARPIKEAQKNLLETVFNTVKISPSNLPATFPEEVIFEVGFGSGENLAHQAKKYPNALCIGCEPFINGVVSLLGKISTEHLFNISIFDDDASLLLQTLPDRCISKAFILFPDPWPKKRHHKRRVVSMENVLLIHQKMQKNGILTIATDHPGYLEWIVEIAKQENFRSHFQPMNTFEDSRPSENEIPITRYEKKALENRPGTFLIFKAI
jgi:tRNA (guanine-N7-)-methyltransferase